MFTDKDESFGGLKTFVEKNDSSGITDSCPRFDNKHAHTTVKITLQSYRSRSNFLISVFNPSGLPDLLSVNKVSVKKSCRALWEESIMFAWSEVVVFFTAKETDEVAGGGYETGYASPRLGLMLLLSNLSIHTFVYC